MDLILQDPQAWVTEAVRQRQEERVVGRQLITESSRWEEASSPPPPRCWARAPISSWKGKEQGESREKAKESDHATEQMQQLCEKSAGGGVFAATATLLAQ